MVKPHTFLSSLNANQQKTKLKATHTRHACHASKRETLQRFPYDSVSVDSGESTVPLNVKSANASWSMPSRIPLAVGVMRGASLVNSTSKLPVSRGFFLQVESERRGRGWESGMGEADKQTNTHTGVRLTQKHTHTHTLPHTHTPAHPSSRSLF